MKKIFYRFSILGSLVALWFPSCDSLNLTPPDYFAQGNYWQNESQVDSYMIGIHRRLRDRMMDLYWLGEPRAALMRTGTGTMGVSLNRSNIIESTLLQSNPGIDNWAGMYSPIFDCNLLIQEVTKMSPDKISSAARDKYLAEAYGLRAYFYFTLLKSFGGVPLVTEPRALTETDVNAMYTARSTAAQTMALVKDDLKKSDDFYATDNFRTVPGRAFWSKAATRTLMGEVYLWAAKVGQSSFNISDLNTALAALQSIPGGAYALMNKYLDVFTYANKGNSEVILAINYDFTSGGPGGDWVENMLYANAGWGGWQTRTGKLIENDTLNLAGVGIQRLEYKWSLFEAYEDNDTRKRTNFFDFYNLLDEDGNLNPLGADGLPTITQKTFVQRKYLGTMDAGGVRRICDDYIVYRYADVLLLIAEVKNALGQDPSQQINAIRERGYRDKNGATKPYPVYSNADFRTNELAIYFERVKEMVMEGKAWNDLCRMVEAPGGDPLVFVAAAGIDGVAVLDKGKEAYKIVWPIGNNVLSADRLVKQNPGYTNF
ncbi:MAG: RagB/SusD family nutrient uptake outer membrane protein [Mucinivorans sp.]